MTLFKQTAKACTSYLFPICVKKTSDTCLISAEEGFLKISHSTKILTIILFNQAKCLQQTTWSKSDKSDWPIVKKQLDINKHTVYTQGLWRLVLFTESISRHWSLLLDLIIEALDALTDFLRSDLEAIFSQIVSSTIIFLCRHVALFTYIIQLPKPFLKFQGKKQAQ